jgi:hypothetical protein
MVAHAARSDARIGLTIALFILAIAYISWLDRFHGYWEPRLEALAIEIARGKRKRRT